MRFILFTLFALCNLSFIYGQAFDGLFLSSEFQLGDPNISYGNPEFSPDGKYMLWFEHDTVLASGEAVGRMWHCGIDLDADTLIPFNGKGYFSYVSSTYKRANIGIDATGPYYVGSNMQGQLIHVRITGNTTGVKTTLATAPDFQRRGIFPSKNPNTSKQYVFFFRADPYPTPGAADSVDVRLIDLDFPTQEILVERQYKTGTGWVPMDLAVPRWFNDLNEFTYGFIGNFNRNQTRHVEITSDTNFTTTDITTDFADHNDPSPFFFQNRRYIMPGINGGLEIRTYREPLFGTTFQPYQSSIPDTSLSFLAQPCRALSNEPGVVDGKYYSVFLLSDCAQGGAFVNSRGEVWLHRINGAANPAMIRVSVPDFTNVINEPEIISDGQKGWIVYSKYPLGGFSTGQDRIFGKKFTVLPTATSADGPLTGLQLYPNPTDGSTRLFWEGVPPVFELQLVDVQGRVLLEVDNPEQLDLSLLAPGIYFAKIYTESGDLDVHRLVKQ